MWRVRNLRHRESSCFRERIKRATEFCLLKLYRDLGNVTSHGNWVRSRKRISKKQAIIRRGVYV